MFSISNCGGRGSTVFPLFKNLYMSVTYLLSLHKPHICLSNILGVWTCLHLFIAGVCKCLLLSQECAHGSFLSQEFVHVSFYRRSVHMSPFIAGVWICLLLSQEYAHVFFYHRSVHITPFSQKCAHVSFLSQKFVHVYFLSQGFVHAYMSL